MTAYDIIKKPILSEKSYDGISDKKYTFEVDKNATKTQIKAAVEEIFKVKVAKVNAWVAPPVELPLTRKLSLRLRPTARASSSSTVWLNR